MIVLLLVCSCKQTQKGASQQNLPIQNFDRAIQGSSAGGTTVSAEIPRGDKLPSPCTHASEFAEMRVTNFLYVSPNEANEDLVESGTLGISKSEVRPVDNPMECQEIIDFIGTNASFQDPKEGIDRTRYHYQTNNFYFVCWVGNRIRLSPVSTTKLIVIKKDFSEAWVY